MKRPISVDQWDVLPAGKINQISTAWRYNLQNASEHWIRLHLFLPSHRCRLLKWYNGSKFWPQYYPISTLGV
jgi:hypothetical protein